MPLTDNDPFSEQAKGFEKIELLNPLNTFFGKYCAYI